MNREKKKHGISLIVQLLLITVVPLLLLGSVLAVTSKIALERGMKKQDVCSECSRGSQCQPVPPLTAPSCGHCCQQLGSQSLSGFL